MIELHELKSGLRVRGLVAAGEVTVVAVEPHGDGIVNVVFRGDDGQVSDRLLTAEQAASVSVASGRRWTFDADGAAFKLASEARRIQLAHLFDPFAAVGSSTIQPLPHQIDAVYGRLLPLQPLKFLLADDPGAGKTIMSGLYVRELMLRGDLERCLVIAPGSLVEQWQEELDDKFDLRFDIMSRDMVEAARTGNPFQERNLLIARLDQLSRSEELQAKLAVTDWDLVIVDEAHKMSARLYGDEVNRTLRFQLGELVRDRARNLLLLTATPHNGSNDDFLLFLSLLDPDRFAGRLRRSKKLPDVSDVMRRLVKENLLTFDGKRLFRERRAITVNYDLSFEEQRLYEAVSSYVQDGMGRAQAIEQGGDRRRGLAIGFALAALQRRLASSPEAIYQSLRRRKEKLTAQLLEAERAGKLAEARRLDGRLTDPDGFDSDDFDDDEFERLEDEAIENVMSAESLVELEKEITELRVLEMLAADVRASGQDRKWVELSNILQSDEFNQPLELAKRGFADVGDAVGFNATAGLAAVLPLMADRSTWRQLRDVNPSARWQRYIRILARGLGSDILDARSISELWPSQRAALEAGLLGSSASLAIRMPTGAGKTRVAELAIVDSLVTHPGSKCIYIAPFRALANEVDQAFSNLFLDLGYGASTIPGGYDQDEMSQELASVDDVLVLTPEKLDLLFRLRGDFLDQVSLIVIDEGHIVADQSRGPKFELLVSRLRRRVPTARILMMSAVVPDETLQDFAIWLGGSSDRFASTSWRPSLLRFGRLDWDGTKGTLRFAANDVVDGGLEFVPNLISQSTFSYVAEETGRRRSPKFPRPDNKGDVAAEVAYRYASLGPVLIFSMQTNWAESIASAMLRRIELAELTDEEVPHEFVLRREGRALAVAAEWMGEDHLVTEYLRRGIAFHHGRLPDAVRDAIEEDFRARRLAVLVATSTLAQGVNLPVRTVVMHSVRSRDAAGSSRVLSSREYWNIAGRAGRAGAETEGTVIHIASTGYDVEDFNRYARERDDVDRVESALHRMLRDLVDQRISSDDAARQLNADLLALLVEEAEGALDAAVLTQTLASSLFAVQALESAIPTEPLISVMTSTAQRIGRDVPEVEARRLYASTGLSSDSCLAIARHVASAGISRSLAALLDEGALDDRDELLDTVLAGLAEVSEMETRAELPVDTRELLSSWIDGTPVRLIASQFDLGDPQEVTEYIEDAFNYRLPWGVSGYLRIATAMMDTAVTSPLVSNLAGMIKYGVPSPEAVWAMTAGVASRRAAIAVADAYLRGDPDRSASGFRRWLARMDPDSVAEQLGFSGGELEATARAILRSQPNEFLARLDTDGELYPLRAFVRPVRSAIDSGLIYELSPGDRLIVRRDRDSRLNRNAVLLLVDRARVGYLQADAARAVALDLDSGADARVTVAGVAEANGATEIEVLIEIAASRG